MSETTTHDRATLEAIRAAYGGDPSLACWQTPEGIAGVIEELSGMARANIVKGYNAGVKRQQDADRQTESEDEARLRYLAENPEILRFLYDMLGEVYVSRKTGATRAGLLKDGADPLEAIRGLIDNERESEVPHV